MNPLYHTSTPQGATSNPSQYPYDSRSHTYYSPSGMNYPAPTGSSNPFSGSYDGTYQGHRQPPSSAFADSRRPYNGLPSADHGAGATYGPGDWLPQPRSASEAYGNQYQQHYLASHHGQSAPVTPYGLQPAPRQHSPSPSSMIQPWALESGGISSSSYLSPGYNSAPLHGQGLSTPSRRLSPSSGRPDTAGMVDQSYRPRSEGKERTRPRAGPPPKAVLGGVGGKTWDELRSIDRSVSTPLPNKSAPKPDTTPVPRSEQGGMPSEAEDAGPMFRGNPIVFRPPLPTYSPPDSPDRPSSTTLRENEGETEDQNPKSPKQPRKPRKEAFPWPARTPKGPPETIPLPLSPSDTTMKGRRRNMRTGISRDIVRDGGGTAIAEGERVPLSIPDPAAWDRLKAEAEERRLLAIQQDPKPVSSDFPIKEVGGEVNERQTKQGQDLPAPSTPSRSQSLQDHARQSLSSSSSAILSPESSRRGTGNRIGDNEFIRRQLGGMIKERTKSSEEVPSLTKALERRRSRNRNSSLYIGESEKPTGHPILGHAQRGSTNDTSGSVRSESLDPTAQEKTGNEAGKSLDWTEMPDDESDGPDRDDERGPMMQSDPFRVVDERPGLGPSKDVQAVFEDLTPLQRARQRVEESRQAKRNADVPSAEKKSGLSLQGDAPMIVPDVQPDPTRKRKIKLANFDGYLGRQLGVSGLLGPKSGKQKELKADIGKAQGEMESAPVPQIPQDKADSQDGPEKTKKRGRSASTLDATGQRIDANPVVTGPTSSVLRPTAFTFQPRPSSGTAFKPVPEDRTSFNFSSDKDGSNVLRPAAAVFMPRQSMSSAIELAVLKNHAPIPPQDDSGSTEAGLAQQEAPSSPRHSSSAQPTTGNTIDEAQDPPVRGNTPNSPAAEMHGIYDSSPVASLSDDDLFYRPPRSDISEIAPEELESFDPVSYSYDPTQDDIFDPSDILTSTPRGEYSHLHDSPGSSQDTSSWHPAQDLESPVIKIAPPHVSAGDAKEKFKTWVFPKSPHGYKPSISRRHTFDIQYDPLQSDDASQASPTRQGVASTFASRVGDLRAFLSRDAHPQGDHLRVSSGPDHVGMDQSVEFPIRSPTKVLAVVNDDTAGDDGPASSSEMGTPPASSSHGVQLGKLMERLQATIEQLLARSEGGQSGDKEEVSQMMKVMMKRLDGLAAPLTDLSHIATALGQQSTLISSLASAVQTQKRHSGDHLVPLLEGQQAIMDRFESLSATNESLANELENISSGISRQHQDQSRTPQDFVPAGRSAMDDLRDQLLQLQLERERNKIEAERSSRELSEAKERVQSLETDLERSKAKSQDTSNEKRDLEAQHRRLGADLERLQSELDHARQALVDDRKIREAAVDAASTQAREMEELRRLHTGLQELLATRLESLDTKLSTPAVSDEAMDLRERSKILEEELSKTRTKVDEAQSQKQAAQLESQEQRSEIEKLNIQLEHEKTIRQEWQNRSGTIESYLAQEREYRREAEVTARERTYVAELQEARIEGLMEDVHHWRSFAMAYDRNAYREYLKSNPFRGFGEDRGSESPVGDDDDNETVKPSRPTKSHTQSGSTQLAGEDRQTDGDGEGAVKAEIVGPL